MTKEHSIDAIHLGKKSEYIDKYSPSLLQPVPRTAGRELIGINTDTLPFCGFDLWTGFELSWLNKKGKPVVGIAEFKIPADSKNLIESKSFKLYLNSLNQSHFDSAVQLASILMTDLSHAAEGKVQVSLFESLRGYSKEICELPGVTIDDLDITVDQYDFDPTYLSNAAPESADVVSEILTSDLLKSNCLVTRQPDWGSVCIKYQGKRIEKEKLLRYFISFRNHNEFHEQCVERIFVDIKKYCCPEKLTVLARYTRRGGLDINPFRSDYETDCDLGRLIRQ